MKAAKTISPAYTVLVAVTAAAVLLTGCATIFNGTRQEISVTSEPPGASVFVNNVSFGQTPTVIDLKRSEKYTVLLELHGFKPFEMTFGRKLNTFFYVNIPVVGWAVDALSGSMYKLTPEEVKAVLESGGPGAPVQPTMPKLPPDSTGAVAPPDEGATITPQQVLPEPVPPDTTEADDDAADDDSTGTGDGTLEAIIEDGKLYVFVVMAPDPNWEKIGQLERVRD